MTTNIFREDAEWQVAVLSFLFLVIGMGNIITTTWTMTAKIRDRQKGYFKFRFTRLDKYFWTHKRRGPESRIVKVRLLFVLTNLCHIIFCENGNNFKSIIIILLILELF